MRTVRCSSLNTAFYCPLAAELDAQWPEAGRAALKSSWFHAHAAGKETEAKLLWERLASDERDDVLTWQTPGDVNVGEATLAYVDALKELPLAIDADFAEVPYGDRNAMIQGHLDFAWVHTTSEGLKVGYVADIKKERWTAPDGPRSLQIKGYAFCFIAKHDLDAYATGIWVATEGRFIWDDQLIRVGSREWAEDARRLRTAASAEGDACIGSHCSDCWSRLHCPVYTAPVAFATVEEREQLELLEERSAALSAALTQGLNEDNALDAVNEIKRLEDLVKLAKDNVKEAIRRGLPVLNEDRSKIYRPVQCAGRASVSTKELQSKYPDIAQELTTIGAPYDRLMWTRR